MGIEVLTASARDYAESMKKPLSSYEMRTAFFEESIEWGNNFKSIDGLIGNAPRGTEAITDYRVVLVRCGETCIQGIFSGTALIPRKVERVSSGQEFSS